MSEELSKRVQQVMEELNYVPHATARQLALRKTLTIGLLMTNMNNDYFAMLLSGVEQVVSEVGYNLLVATYHPNSRDDYPPPLGAHNTDGLLIYADTVSARQIEQYYDRDFPVVLIHRTPARGINIPYVTVENVKSTRKLIEHLITVHGCRKIVFLRGPESQEDSHSRETGFREALAAHDIEFDESLVMRGGFERDISYKAIKSFLQKPNRPEFDAVFAGDDNAAIGVLIALKEAGLRVPEDVRVVGFDDLRMSPYLTPSLTTVRAPIEEVGRSAAMQLFHLLNGKKAEPAVLHSTTIVLRRSCGCDFQP